MSEFIITEDFPDNQQEFDERFSVYCKVIFMVFRGDSLFMKNLSDRRLWGNEAADDELPEILNAYFLSQQEFADFFSSCLYVLQEQEKDMANLP